MRSEEHYYIELFDEYAAMRLSHSELTCKVNSDFPSIQLESELEWYVRALDYLQLKALSDHIKTIHESEYSLLEVT